MLSMCQLARRAPGAKLSPTQCTIRWMFALEGWAMRFGRTHEAELCERIGEPPAMHGPLDVHAARLGHEAQL